MKINKITKRNIFWTLQSFIISMITMIWLVLLAYETKKIIFVIIFSIFAMNYAVLFFDLAIKTYAMYKYKEIENVINDDNNE
ncbi:MAG: hypothetical protein PHN22_04725 [Candidatus ainarchaeum sp.]|nr:hypothetical protein [Candidatus ainarchaeum sp.]